MHLLPEIKAVRLRGIVPTFRASLKELKELGLQVENCEYNSHNYKIDFLALE